MSRVNYYTLDVFTETMYGGNQLAVFPDARPIDPRDFQKIARELNLSETVFLFPPENETSTKPHSMRIFTPATELPTAGHPTIGTAYYLATKLAEREGRQRIILNQNVGPIEIEVVFRNGKPHMLTMHQPLPTFGPVHNSRLSTLAKLLSIHQDDFEDLPVQEVSCGNNTLIIPLKSTEVLGRVKFRTDVWENIRDEVHHPLVYLFTTKGVKGANVQGRMFGPEVGIAEDPATGSANGPLICYLVKHAILPAPVVSLQGYEMGRPSQLYLDAVTDEGGTITQVKVGGKCVFTGEGQLYIHPK